MGLAASRADFPAASDVGNGQPKRFPIRVAGGWRTLMRILTWNIHGARDASIAEIAGEIAAHEADVVCLNEVKRSDGKRLRDALRMRAFVASSFIGPYGNAILTNEPVTSWHPLRFSRVRRVDRRDAAIITLADGSMIGAIHLGLRPPERSRSAAELLAALPDRAIIAGDANETPERPAVLLLSGRFDDAGRQGGELTFPAAAPHSRIDYVWVPKGTRVRACRVVPTAMSDHLPVIVDIDPLSPAPEHGHRPHCGTIRP